MPTPPAANRLRRALRLCALSAIPLCSACDSGPSADAGEPDFELEEVGLSALQEGMESGRWTSRSLVEAYLARIEEMDRQGPTLRSMLDLNPDALAIADSLDAERERGSVRGPLHGIPIVVKDNVATADRMTTTAGSRALAGSIAPRDAFIVQRLRGAGAVILGKANLSEWANFRSTRSSSGWSGRGGQVRNPYVLDRSPCGSSSGTAAAVAASFAAAGIGTETDGSIVCPSGATGLVGVKPTMGLVSRTGIIPISHSQDVAGPMARTVLDAAILLGAIAGVDPADSVTAASRGRPTDYASGLHPNGLRGRRIGVARASVTGYSPPADRLFEQAVVALRRAGAIVVDSTDIVHLGDYDDAELTILLYEFKHGLNAYLAGLGEGAPVRSLGEIIRFNDRDRDSSLAFFGQEIMLMAQGKGALTEREYLEAKETVRMAGRGIDEVMERHDLDAIVAPTGSPAWTIDLVNGDHFIGASSTPAAVSGYPSVTVTMGFASGLPVGLSFIGRPWSEGELLRFAYAYEQGTRHRRPPPRFLPTLGH